MNKKIFIIFLVAIFLIASIGFVSASEDSKDISVAVKWNDGGNSMNRPGAITVSLIHDGQVVDTASLSASNSWKATFKNQEDSGSYSISVNGASGYTLTTGGNSNSGFIITGNLIEEPTLGAANDEDIISDDEPTNDQPTNDQPTNDGSDTTGDNNGTDNNSTDNETDNSTDDSSSNKTTPKKDDNNKKSSKDSSSSKKTADKKKVVKKDKAKPAKKNKTTKKLKDTGLPVALVLVAMVTIFIPIARKK